LNRTDDARARVFRWEEAAQEPAASGFAAPAGYGLATSRVPMSRPIAPIFLIRLTLAIIGFVIAASGLAAPAQFGAKNVLFISSERSDMPAMRELEETMRSVFHASHDPEIDFFPEYLDFARFPVEKYGDSDVK